MKLTPLDPWIAAKVGQGRGPVSRAVLEAYQLQKVRDTLWLARARSAFYRQHLAAAPPELASLADLRRLPCTTPADIRHQPLQFLCVSQGEIQRVVTLSSSGTTGEPKRLYFTGADQELTFDFFHVGMSTLVGPGDRVLILLPAATPGGVGDLLAAALGRLGAVAVKHGPVRNVARTLEVMAHEQVNSLVGIPTQVLALARARDQDGFPAPHKLKSALLTTDFVSPAIVAAVEGAWGCEVYNHYGMTEMGLGGGVECQARHGYHLREADLYFEIVHPESGEPLPEGEKGEVVFTTLTRVGMPLIRYRTGDLGRFLPEPCPCGTALKTLERIRDRITGRVPVGPGLHLTIADLDDGLFPIEGVLDFHGAVTQQETWDCLSLKIQVAPGTREAVSAALARALDSVPVLRQARSAGHLEVVVALQASNDCLPPPSKRTLLDCREKPARKSRL